MIATMVEIKWKNNLQRYFPEKTNVLHHKTSFYVSCSDILFKNLVAFSKQFEYSHSTAKIFYLVVNITFYNFNGKVKF